MSNQTATHPDKPLLPEPVSIRGAAGTAKGIRWGTVAEDALPYALAFSPPVAFVLTLLLTWLRRGRIRLAVTDPWSLRILVALAVLGALSTMAAPVPALGLEGMLAMAAVFWFWLAGRFVVDQPRQFWLSLQRAIGIVGALAVLTAFTQTSFRLSLGSWSVTIWGPENKGTVFGLGGNGLGPLLVFGSVLALARLWRERGWWNRLEASVITVACLVGPLALGVRNALWGAVAGALALIPLTGPAPLAAVALIVGTAVALRPAVWDRLVTLVVTQLTSEEIRLGLWQAALGMVLDHPWLGVGPDHFPVAHPQYALPPSREFTDPHSIYLRVASEWGLPAAAILYGWFFSWLRRLWRLRSETWRWSLVAGVMSFLAMGVFDTPLFTFHVSAPVMVGLGLAAASSRTRCQKRTMSSHECRA